MTVNVFETPSNQRIPLRPNPSIQNQDSKIQNRHRRSAFTLLEMVVVVTIIALLAVMIAPKLLGRIGRTKHNIARSEVATIASQLSMYLVDHGMTTPPSDLELNALVPEYFKQSDLKDPWGREYLLVIPGESGEAWDVVSRGADGEPGGEGENKDI